MQDLGSRVRRLGAFGAFGETYGVRAQAERFGLWGFRGLGLRA